jgi:hypothetical protein
MRAVAADVVRVSLFRHSKIAKEDKKGSGNRSLFVDKA